jgi:hypothetical protein
VPIAPPAKFAAHRFDTVPEARRQRRRRKHTTPLSPDHRLAESGVYPIRRTTFVASPKKPNNRYDKVLVVVSD